MEHGKMNVGDAIEQIGFGKFHILALLILSMRTLAIGSKEGMLAILEPYLRCKRDLDFLSSTMIVLPEVFITLFASTFVGRMADKYGRRSMMLLFFSMHGLFSLLYSLSSSLAMIAITRAGIGFLSGSNAITFTYLVEILPTRGRKYVSTFSFMYLIGSMYSIVAAILCFEHLNWRWYVALTEAIPLTIAAISVSWLPESPRHLSVTGQEIEALAVLQRIANTNSKQNGYLDIDKHETMPASNNCNDEKVDILPRWELAKRIAFNSLLTFIQGVLVQSVRYGTMQIGENSEAVECGRCTEHMTYKYRWAMDFGIFFSIILSYHVIAKVKRSTAFRVTFILIIAVWSLYYLNTRGWFLMLITFFISSFETVYYSLVSLYRVETIPTYARSTGVGIAEASRQFGCLVGMFLPLYVNHIDSRLSFGFGHGLLIAGFISTFVIFVETKDEQIRDH